MYRPSSCRTGGLDWLRTRPSIVRFPFFENACVSVWLDVDWSVSWCGGRSDGLVKMELYFSKPHSTAMHEIAIADHCVEVFRVVNSQIKDQDPFRVDKIKACLGVNADLQCCCPTLPCRCRDLGLESVIKPWRATELRLMWALAQVVTAVAMHHHPSCLTLASCKRDSYDSVRQMFFNPQRKLSWFGRVQWRVVVLSGRCSFSLSSCLLARVFASKMFCGLRI